MHLKTIRYNQPLIAELLAKKLGQYLIGQCRRLLFGFKIRKDHMCSHDQVYLLFNSLPEWNQFNLLKTVPAMRYHSKA
ncbi:hypothetical protein D3C85_1501680 [compost metagenome]